jgi:hypothetical protein
MHHDNSAGNGVHMETYQIRIVRNGREITAEACKQASDYAAIRHARSLADIFDHVEVWRGSRCLYTGSPVERDS